MDDLLVGFSFQYMNQNKNYSVIINADEMKKAKKNGSDYLQQVFNQLIEKHPELEQTLEGFLEK